MRLDQISSTSCQSLSTTTAQIIRFQHHGGLSISATFRINSFASSQTLFVADDFVSDRKVHIEFDASCNCVRLQLWLSSAVMWQTYTAPGMISEGHFATLTFRIIPALKILDIWKHTSLVTWNSQSAHTQVCFLSKLFSLCLRSVQVRNSTEASKVNGPPYAVWQETPVFWRGSACLYVRTSVYIHSIPDTVALTNHMGLHEGQPCSGRVILQAWSFQTHCLAVCRLEATMAPALPGT